MEKKIIVAEKEYDSLLLSIREKDPSASFKIIHPGDFLSLSSFSYKSDPLPTLIVEFGYSYKQAKKCADLLRAGNVSENAGLSSIFERLKELGLISVDPYGIIELNKAEVCFLEMKDEEELHLLAKINNIPYRDITLADLGLEKCNDETVAAPPIYIFKNKFEQFFYVYSDIRRRMIDGEKADDIVIHIADTADLFYCELCSSLFKVPSLLKMDIPFLSEVSVKRKVGEIYSEKSFDCFSDEEMKNETLKALSELISFYRLNEIPFDRGYASLLEMLSSLSTSESKSSVGVILTNKYVIEPHKHVYVTDFVTGSFYEVKEDNNILDDASLCKIGANPSYVLTSLDREKKLNYLRYNDIVFLSHAEEHLSDSIYPSQFMAELPTYKGKAVKMSARNEEGVYTKKTRDLLFSKEMDDAFCRKTIGEYRSYDHSYKKIEGYVSPFTSGRYSVTNLEKYIKCPFAYLYSSLVPTAISSFHYMDLGTLIHKVMEGIYDDDFSFEKAFEEGKREYEEAMLKRRQTMGNVQKAYLELVRPHLERVVGELRAWKEYCDIYDQKSEQRIEWDLCDGDKKYHFVGYIDKLVVFGRDKPEFYYVIDYKTGSESFVPEAVFLGSSTQLPLYLYALENNEEEKEKLVSGARFAGFGIQQMYASSLKKAYYDKGVLSEKTFYKNSAFSGVSLTSDEDSFWSLSDRTAYKENKGSLVCTGDGYFLRSPQSFVSMSEGTVLKNADKKGYKAYTLAELIEEAKESTIETIKKIENADFPIAPANRNDLLKPASNKNSDLTCAFCAYADICYHDSYKDPKDFSRIIAQHFRKGEEDDR